MCFCVQEKEWPETQPLVSRHGALGGKLFGKAGCSLGHLPEFVKAVKLRAATSLLFNVIAVILSLLSPLVSQTLGSLCGHVGRCTFPSNLALQQLLPAYLSKSIRIALIYLLHVAKVFSSGCIFYNMLPTYNSVLS